MSYVPLATCIVSFIFSLVVIDQFFVRRRPYQLLWAIGLLMYCVSTFTEFWWNVYGHVDILYRLWYLLGAILVAAYLGQGTLYFLMRRRNAHIVMAVLGAATVYATARIFTANLDISGLTTLTGVGVMPLDIRAVVTPLLNTFGTVALVGGAIYSAVIFWRKRVLPHRVVANVLIAAGALLPAAGGIHLSVDGGINLFFIFELVGVIVMFIGFLRAREVFGFYRFPLVHGFKKVSGRNSGDEGTG
jgi:hypothetical protein